MAEYRIDELARAAGTSVRNVRVYQDRGLLPAPSRRGRAAIYGDGHLSRLRLVINMLDRGYAFAQIKEMLAAWKEGKSLAEVLGLEETFGESWSGEQPERISTAGLRAMFGGQVTPENTRRAIELGLLERHGSSFVVPSPKLLNAGRELVALGVPLPLAMDIAGTLQRDIDAVAKMLVAAIYEHVVAGATAIDDPQILTELFTRVRALIQDTLDASVARTVNRVLPDMMSDHLLYTAGRERQGEPRG